MGFESHDFKSFLEYCDIIPTISAALSSRKVTSLGSNLASVTDLKELKLHAVYAVISEAINLYNMLVKLYSSSLGPSLSPCQSFGNISKGCSRS